MNGHAGRLHRIKRRLRRRSAGGLAGVAAAAVVLALIPGVQPSSANPAPAPAASSDDLWTSSSAEPRAQRNGHYRRVNPSDYAAFTLDGPRMRALLATAPDEHSRAARRTPLMVAVPAPTGELVQFAVAESAVMESKLAASNPDITTYAGRGVVDPTMSIRLDFTRTGFHASVRGPVGRNAWYVDPAYEGDTSLYLSYFADDLPAPSDQLEQDPIGAVRGLAKSVERRAGEQVQQRVYRLALLTDPTYATYFGTANVLSEKVTLINRVNHVYNDDLAIKLVLIDGSDALNLDTTAKSTGANGPCGSAACFTEAQMSGCASGTLSRNRIVLGQLVGASAYDIGHVAFGLNGGGIAGLGVVGGDGKARGCTGLPQPTGDFFAVDYVAHEMGHQFSGNHTFNGTQGNCSGSNRNAGTSVEPGSGSSVMAYAGICDQDDLQPHTDPYFSQRSIEEITTYVTSALSAINEVQTVSLRNFDGTDSFTLGYGAGSTGTITRGSTYNAVTLAAELTTLVGSPVTVSGFGGSGSPGDTGFQVTFTGAVNFNPLTITPTGGDVTGFVGETAKGGPVDNGGTTVTPTANNEPIVNAPAAKTIPIRTPFELTGSATDASGPLTYSWEQNDPGSASGTALVSNTKLNGALFRQFDAYAPVTPTGTLQYNSPGENHAGTSPTRVFPDMDQILHGTTNASTGSCPAAPASPAAVPLPTLECYAEFLPTAAYVPTALNFRLTARDGVATGGGIGFADVTLTLDKTAGPFLVTSQASPSSVAGGSSGDVTWDVAGTAGASLAPNVKISLSVDGGLTFSQVLVASTPNDGTESVTWPQVDTTEARIKVEAVGNYFFDVNDADFTVAATVETLTVTDSGDTSAQYSDPISPVTVSASASDANGTSLTGIASGFPLGLALVVGGTSANDVRPGTRTWTMSGEPDDGFGTYAVDVVVDDGGALTQTASFNVDVLRENATPTYTGMESVSESAPDGTIEVPMSATVTEADDGFPGDVTNASVNFVDSNTLATLCSAPVLGGPASGTAACNASVDVAPGETVDLDVQPVIVGDYYEGTSAPTAVSVTNTFVAVEPPETSFTSEPGRFVLATRVRYGFTSDDPAATYNCEVDGDAKACAAPSYRTPKVHAGTHWFLVAAENEAGPDPTPEIGIWTRPLNDTGLKPDKHWTSRKAKKSYGGSYREAEKKGATLTYQAQNATAFALVATKGKGYGKVNVFLGKKKLKTVNLGSKKRAKTRQLIFVAELASPKSGTVKIKTTSGKPVRIEGLGVETPPLG